MKRAIRERLGDVVALLALLAVAARRARRRRREAALGAV